MDFYFSKTLTLLLSGETILKVKRFSHTVDSNLLMLCFIGSQKSFIKNELLDNNGGMLVLDVVIDNENFTLICITPAFKLNNQKLSELTLTKLWFMQNSIILFSGDFNLVFKVTLKVMEKIQFLKDDLLGK